MTFWYKTREKTWQNVSREMSEKCGGIGYQRLFRSLGVGHKRLPIVRFMAFNTTKCHLWDCKTQSFAARFAVYSMHDHGLYPRRIQHLSLMDTVQKMLKRCVRLHTLARLAVLRWVSVVYDCTRFLPIFQSEVWCFHAEGLHSVKRKYTLKAVTSFGLHFATRRHSGEIAEFVHYFWWMSANCQHQPVEMRRAASLREDSPNPNRSFQRNVRHAFQPVRHKHVISLKYDDRLGFKADENSGKKQKKSNR